MNAMTLGQAMDQAVERSMRDEAFAATGKTVAELDAITRARSCFTSFAALLNAPGNYRPTISIRSREDLLLALAYDAAQAVRGDARRAFTAGSMPQVGDRVGFYSQNAWRSGRIEKIGRRRVTVSFLYKHQLAELRKNPSSQPRRVQRQIHLAGLTVAGTDMPRAWKVA